MMLFLGNFTLASMWCVERICNVIVKELILYFYEYVCVWCLLTTKKSLTTDCPERIGGFVPYKKLAMNINLITDKLE